MPQRSDPERDEPLIYLKRHFLTPYVTPKTTMLEIGPGGGRWTRYLLAARMVEWSTPSITIKNCSTSWP